MSTYGQPGSDPNAAYPQPGYAQAGYPQNGYNQPGYPMPGAATYEPPKSKVAAALLAFFLGTLGVHNFYLGDKKKGVGHLALAGVTVVLIIVVGITSAATVSSSIDPSTGMVDESAASSGLAGAGLGFILVWLIAAANGIWAFVEFIMILMRKDLQ